MRRVDSGVHRDNGIVGAIFYTRIEKKKRVNVRTTDKVQWNGT